VCVASQVGAGAQNVAICPLENAMRHVRIVGLTAARAHASTQLFLGLTDAAGPQAALTAGQFKLQLYGGGQPQPPPDLGAYFGPDSVGFEGPHDFINVVSTICLDVHPGSASTRAAVVLWLDGHHGADCEDRSTLTFANRYGHVWAPNSGALNDDGVYFYQSGGTQTPVVTLSDTPAVAYEDVPPPDCTVTDLSASPTARYVALCELDAPVRHVRITGLMTEAMHGTVSFLVGYPAPANTAVGPVGPGAGQLRAQFYIGGPRLDVGFHGAATQATGDYAFLSTASTVCFDIHDGGEATPPYFVLWRDGGERGRLRGQRHAHRRQRLRRRERVRGRGHAARGGCARPHAAQLHLPVPQRRARLRQRQRDRPVDVDDCGDHGRKRRPGALRAGLRPCVLRFT
jgi:hypothetical protein